MKSLFSFFLFTLLLSAGSLWAQITDTLDLKGDLDKFYPVSFHDGGNVSNVATVLEIGRSSVHLDGQWSGSLIAKFRFHTYNWGNGSDFIDADIRQEFVNNPNNNNFIAGWTDASGTNSDGRILIWLRGNTTYYYKANYAVSPAIYDGVHNTLPYQQAGGPTFTYKTAVDAYVNRNGMSYAHTAHFNGAGANYFSGNVGIGAALPAAKLHVAGTRGTVFAKFTEAGIPAADGYLNIINNTQIADSYIPTIIGRSKTAGRPLGLNLIGEADDLVPSGNDVNYAAVVLDGRSKTGSRLSLSNVLAVCSYGQNLMVVKADGSVGIGAADTRGYKLAVAGSMIAEKVKVKLQSAWPDYVFEEDYKLPDLKEVAKYIKKHQRLPGMPSAEEMEKEGVDVGEMNGRLLKQVEEMMLYIIQQQQVIQEQEKRLQQLEAKYDRN